MRHNGWNAIRVTKKTTSTTGSTIVDFKHTELYDNFQGEPFKLEPTYPSCIPDDLDPMPLKIETGIPIPNKMHRVMQPENQEIVDALGKLEPGQSIFIPTSADRLAQNKAHMQLQGWMKRYYAGKKFTKRSYLKGEPTGIRIWRLE